MRAVAVAVLLLLPLTFASAAPALLAPAPVPHAQLVGGPVAMSILGFSPAAVVIFAGDSITWENHEDFTHTATNVLGGAPDSGDVLPHTSFTATFPDAGVIVYRCLHHAEMVGVVVVLP